MRFDANLGILDHEKAAPQPIQVDAELNLGPQPLLPHDDDINHVLDYRKVRQIIIDECRSEHVNLLESMIGKLANRLLQLPGVIGVRVKIVKLEIFDDCEVAIRAETGTSGDANQTSETGSDPGSGQESRRRRSAAVEIGL